MLKGPDRSAMREAYHGDLTAMLLELALKHSDDPDLCTKVSLLSEDGLSECIPMKTTFDKFGLAAIRSSSDRGQCTLSHKSYLFNRRSNAVIRSTQSLQVALLDELIHITLSDIELTVLRQSEGSVFRLDLSSILQHSDINENVLWRLQVSRQVNVGPMTLVGREEVAVLVDILLLFGTQTAGRSTLTSSCIRTCRCLLDLGDISALPAHGLELVGPGLVVGHETALISSHGEMMDQKCTSQCWIICWIE